MNRSDFLYELPEERIAQRPVEPRNHSRLMVIDRRTDEIYHRHFYDIGEYLEPGDALVINDTRVIPARLYGTRSGGGACEILLLRQLGPKKWETIVKPGKKLRTGAEVTFGDGRLRARIEEITADGGRIIGFECDGPMEEVLDTLGEMPLPPYIHEKLDNRERYQTVYARQSGSAAAPTAGLHFTSELLESLRKKGVEIIPILLHVGLGTFRPVKTENIEEHHMHSEYRQITEEAADRINAVKKSGGRIVAVGTTSVRTLESSQKNGIVYPASGDTDIFIKPGYKYTVVDSLITNFHLPGSTLLMLVSAFYDREKVLEAYRMAVKMEYRFFSFGDAMLIL